MRSVKCLSKRPLKNANLFFNNSERPFAPISARLFILTLSRTLKIVRVSNWYREGVLYK